MSLVLAGARSYEGDFAEWIRSEQRAPAARNTRANSIPTFDLHRRRRPHSKPALPVALIPVKFHDNLLAGDDIAGEKFTYVAIERTNFAAIESSPFAIGPIDSPQTCLRIEQTQGKAFEGLTVKLGRENIEVAKAP